jgi:hypothetical protein
MVAAVVTQNGRYARFVRCGAVPGAVPERDKGAHTGCFEPSTAHLRCIRLRGPICGALARVSREFAAAPGASPHPYALDATRAPRTGKHDRRGRLVRRCGKRSEVGCGAASDPNLAALRGASEARVDKLQHDLMNRLWRFAAAWASGPV